MLLWARRDLLASGCGAALLPGCGPAAAATTAPVPPGWRAAWPRTDFARARVSLDEIRDGGPPKDGIPAIDAPRFRPAGEEVGADPREPVIGLELAGRVRGYPLRILIWHEIVNDTLAGIPVAVTYCPLCNTAIVFDRRLEGRVLDFGTTGKLRRSDLVMYDRQTESWWQQYTGEAIVGELAGARLAMLPARLESRAELLARAPDAELLVPSDPTARPYGSNPYVGYDRARFPFLYDGPLPEGVAPMTRVVVVGGQAWTLELLASRGRIETGDLVLSWHPGQLSALDAARILDSREVGSVRVQRRTAAGLEDVVHHVTFAFVLHAFEPGAVLHR